MKLTNINKKRIIKWTFVLTVKKIDKIIDNTNNTSKELSKNDKTQRNNESASKWNKIANNKEKNIDGFLSQIPVPGQFNLLSLFISPSLFLNLEEIHNTTLKIIINNEKLKRILSIILENSILVQNNK